MGWDSNPRAPRGTGGFQDRRLHFQVIRQCAHSPVNRLNCKLFLKKKSRGAAQCVTRTSAHIYTQRPASLRTHEPAGHRLSDGRIWLRAASEGVEMLTRAAGVGTAVGNIIGRLRTFSIAPYETRGRYAMALTCSPRRARSVAPAREDREARRQLSALQASWTPASVTLPSRTSRARASGSRSRGSPKPPPASRPPPAALRHLDDALRRQIAVFAERIEDEPHRPPGPAALQPPRRELAAVRHHRPGAGDVGKVKIAPHAEPAAKPARTARCRGIAEGARRGSGSSARPPRSARSRCSGDWSALRRGRP